MGNTVKDIDFNVKKRGWVPNLRGREPGSVETWEVVRTWHELSVESE